MIEQGLAQQRMWLAGDVGDGIASGDGPSGSVLGEEVERMAREMVESMEDINVSEIEVDRALASPGPEVAPGLIFSKSRRSQ